LNGANKQKGKVFQPVIILGASPKRFSDSECRPAYPILVPCQRTIGNDGAGAATVRDRAGCDSNSLRTGALGRGRSTALRVQ
jgi:hypothetical protein